MKQSLNMEMAIVMARVCIALLSLFTLFLRVNIINFLLLHL